MRTSDHDSTFPPAGIGNEQSTDDNLHRPFTDNDADLASIDSALLRGLLSAIDGLRDPTHVLAGLSALAAEQSRDTPLAELTTDLEQEATRVIAAIERVLHAAGLYDRFPDSSGPDGFRLGADVLIVDDNAVNQALTAAQLRQLELASHMAMSGKEALDYLQTRTPRVILMDWHMVGMDGLETTQRIRSFERRNHRPRTPIVGLTAQAMAGDRERCTQAGMDGFLAKPVPLAELREELERWL